MLPSHISSSFFFNTCTPSRSLCFFLHSLYPSSLLSINLLDHSRLTLFPHPRFQHFTIFLFLSLKYSFLLSLSLSPFLLHFSPSSSLPTRLSYRPVPVFSSPLSLARSLPLLPFSWIHFSLSLALLPSFPFLGYVLASHARVSKKFAARKQPNWTAGLAAAAPHQPHFLYVVCLQENDTVWSFLRRKNKTAVLLCVGWSADFKVRKGIFNVINNVMDYEFNYNLPNIKR